MSAPKNSRIFLALPGILFVIAWQLAVLGSSRREFLFGSPLAVGMVAVRELSRGNIFLDVGTTAVETILGLLLGSVAGTLLGLSVWINSRVAHIVKPYVVMLGSVPIFAVAPMMIIWFGTGLLSKIFMAAFSTCLISFSQAYEGAMSANVEHLMLAKSFRASSGQVLFKIVVPSAFAWVLAGFKLNVGFALVGAFVGEFVSSNSGVGHYILRASGLYDVPRVLFGILVLACLALTVTGCIAWCERRWFPWVRSMAKGA